MCLTIFQKVISHTGFEPGNKILAALDFRHVAQKGNDRFMKTLKRTFQKAFGHDSMSTETKNVFLYGKLQISALNNNANSIKKIVPSMRDS